MNSYKLRRLYHHLCTAKQEETSRKHLRKSISKEIKNARRSESKPELEESLKRLQRTLNSLISEEKDIHKRQITQEKFSTKIAAKLDKLDGLPEKHDKDIKDVKKEFDELKHKLHHDHMDHMKEKAKEHVRKTGKKLSEEKLEKMLKIEEFILKKEEMLERLAEEHDFEHVNKLRSKLNSLKEKLQEMRGVPETLP